MTYLDIRDTRLAIRNLETTACKTEARYASGLARETLEWFEAVDPIHPTEDGLDNPRLLDETVDVIYFVALRCGMSRLRSLEILPTSISLSGSGAPPELVLHFANALLSLPAGIASMQTTAELLRLLCSVVEERGIPVAAIKQYAQWKWAFRDVAVKDKGLEVAAAVAILAKY